jgi:hypothetical protein
MTPGERIAPLTAAVRRRDKRAVRREIAKLFESFEPGKPVDMHRVSAAADLLLDDTPQDRSAP